MTPIKLSELEKVLDRIIKERENICGSGVRSSFRVDDISRLCEAIRIAHGELKSIKLTGYSDHVKLRQIADKALTKINSLVDLS